MTGFRLPGGESLTAELAETQTALEDTVADLQTARAAQRRAEQEMDVVQGSLTELAALYESATAETARAEQERDALGVKHVETLAELSTARGELALIGRQRDTLRQDLTRWIARVAAMRLERSGREHRLQQTRIDLVEARAAACPDPTAHQTTEGAPA